MPKKENGNKGERKKVLDLNTRILIAIRDELRALNGKVEHHTSILDQHTSILDQHTSILLDHSKRLKAVEMGVKELSRETRKWVAHFDRDYMHLANAFEDIRLRVEKCEAKLQSS